MIATKTNKYTILEIFSIFNALCKFPSVAILLVSTAIPSAIKTKTVEKNTNFEVYIGGYRDRCR